MVKRIETKTAKGETRFFVVRQLPHDKIVKIGSKLFGNIVIAIQEVN